MLSMVLAGAFMLFLLDEALGIHFRPFSKSNPSESFGPASKFKSSGALFGGIGGPSKQLRSSRNNNNNNNNTPSQEVKHAFAWSEDRKFVAVDRYFVDLDGVTKVAVVGDGTVPLTFKNPNIVIGELLCDMGDEEDRPARVVMMRGDKRPKQHYDTEKKYPFSTNGDNFKSLIIYCDIVHVDKDARDHPPLTIKGKRAQDNFKVTIDSPFVRTGPEAAPGGLVGYGPPPSVGELRSNPEDYKTVHCMCPMYGLKNARWLIEWLEYHRAVGVAHVHLYSYDPLTSEPLRTAMEHYKKEGFVTPHDWSHEASQGFTQGHTYEHAKWLAMSDCLLRSRGVADFVLFSDLDEIVNAPDSQGSLGPAMLECHDAHLQASKTKLGCSFNSHTITSVYTKLSASEVEEEKKSNTLLLERYSYEEAKPMCPYNCNEARGGPTKRKFHYGRQKYMVYTGDTGIAPVIPWTHAIWRDYGLADIGMEILKDHVIHVRHYQGHWYKNTDSLTTVREKPAHLSPKIMDQIRAKIQSTSTLKNLVEKYPGNGGLKWIEPVDRGSAYKHGPPTSGSSGSGGGLPGYQCTAEQARRQEDRIAKRFKEWWSHSACPDQVWMETFPGIVDTIEKKHKGYSKAKESSLVVVDIGCNKGYTSADFLDLLHPSGDFNAKTLHTAINDVAKDRGTKYKRACGACGDCQRPLEKTRSRRMRVEVHCFEPSPATYDMLLSVDEKLDIKTRTDGMARWVIHNKGLHDHSGILAWHKACKNAVGDELCTIVDESTPEAIKVPVTTVDEFASQNLDSKDGLIHMLKIDAEGLDPAVLKGATDTLKKQKAIYVMFEFNPGLRDKKPPYGMWGVAEGLTKLLEVTEWLDTLSYDCYLDSRVDGPDGIDAPPLYRITGGCIRKDPKIAGWSNVICASRAFPSAVDSLFELSMVGRE